MIAYETYCKIRLLHREQGLNFEQIGRELGLDPETVSKYARAERYERRSTTKGSSKLDPFKALITGWLDRHPYSIAQIFQRLRGQHGYDGGLSIVGDYVRTVRPARRPAFLTLAFEPGEAAQVDWGYGGAFPLESGSRRLSFFVMVLCYSRLVYVEFTLGEALEHFLECHQKAFEFFGGTPATVLIDNLKTGVLRHPLGEKAVFHPRYVELAAHYGFAPRACTVRQPHEKGRVENAVGYVKKNFLAGLELPTSLSALNTAARQWMDEVANVRIHGETRQQPRELFTREAEHLRALPPLPADTGVIRTVRATNRCRVVFETNRYSVPAIYASQRLTMKVFADRLCLYHSHKLIATHPRSYHRHRDFENADHLKELIAQRRNAREARLLLVFYALSPRAEEYHRQLVERRLNPRTHLHKIVALADIYGREKVTRALEDAFAFEAFSSEYIANILEQRERLPPQSSPLHLTRRADLLEVELEAADLRPYDQPPITRS
jgi:transposase